MNHRTSCARIPCARVSISGACLILALALLLSACVPALPTDPAAAARDAAEATQSIRQVTVRAAVEGTRRYVTITPTPTLPPTYTPTPTISPTPTPFVPTTAATFASCLPPTARMQAGVVTRVIDATTILVNLDGQEVPVRYLGVRAPGPGQFYNAEAQRYNRLLVEGKPVTLIKDTSEADSSGRLLRHVFVGRMYINQEMLVQGMATVAIDAQDAACNAEFLLAEQAANAKHVGVWSRLLPTKTPLDLGREHRLDPPACNCTGPELDCSDFSTQALAQACYTYCEREGFGDIFNLAENLQRKACSYLP